MFSGLSVLRKAEKKEPTKQDKALQDYLKRQYGGGETEDEPKRKKKKKSKQGPSAIAIVDADITGLAPVSEAAAKPVRPDLDDAADSEGALLLLMLVLVLMHASTARLPWFSSCYCFVSFDFLQVMSQSLLTLKKQKRCGSR